jgi:hypothetical protein
MRLWGGCAFAGFAVALALLASSAYASGGTTCEWTGTFTVTPGLTNDASATPLKFTATGALKGDSAPCVKTNGQSRVMTFDGWLGAGSSCITGFPSNEGTVEGIPRVVSYAEPRGSAASVGELFGPNGANAGTFTAFVSPLEPALECGTPEGYPGGDFTSLVEFF